MEHNEHRDYPYLPEDAGEYAEELMDILNRIPDGWGRWLSLGKGWYPLVIEINHKLRFMYPDYEIHQVKEKYGTLRYYYGFPHDPDKEKVNPMIGDIMDDIITAAEQISTYTCETCGGRGRTRMHNYWYKTLCKYCANEQGYPLEDWEMI